MEFRVLGTVEVRDVDQCVVPVPPARVRALLATLLLRPRQVISIAELIERLWDSDDDLPEKPTGAVQTYVKRLRSIIGADVVQRRAQGYLIDAAPVDLVEFRRLVASAPHAADMAAERDLLERALGLWRDTPLADIESASLRSHEIPRLVEEQLAAVERLMDVRLQLGESQVLVPELTALARTHRQRERFTAQLMIVLYRSNRQADSLAAYDDLAATLAEQLGIDPGFELQQLRQSVLTNSPELSVPSPPATAVPRVVGNPPQFQLPLDTAAFVGRERLIGLVEGLLRGTAGVPVVILSGPPGVGKTTLALRVGHRLRDRFPDGQWYVQLRGMSRQPREIDEVLAELLRTGGVPATEIPDGVEARSASLRSCLSGKRVLLFLDDARVVEQVRPLLPATGGAAVLVTSRRELWGLAVMHGAQGVSISVLDDHEATEVIERAVGASRVRAEPAPTAELIKLCGSFPLALRVAGANLAAHTGTSIERYVRELRIGDRLRRLTIAGDPGAAVGAAFELSYIALPGGAQRAFRLIGLLPGPDFTADSAAALLDLPVDSAVELLEELAVANLITRRDHRRYDFYDLMRLYAAQRGAEDEERKGALQRLFSWYLRTTDAACEFGFRSAARSLVPTTERNPFPGAAEGLAWLDAERLNLLALIHLAADDGPARFAWELADALRWYLRTRGRLTEWSSSTADGLRAARAAGDLVAEGTMLGSLAALKQEMGDSEAAIRLSTESIERHRMTGNTIGEAVQLGALGLAQRDRGDVRAAVRTLQTGIVMLRSAGRPELLDVHLLNLGVIQTDLGELEQAIDSATDSLACSRSDIARCVALMNRGWVQRLTGDYGGAMSDLTEALNLELRPEPGVRIELASLNAISDELDAATLLALEALRLCRASNRKMIEADALNCLGDIARRESLLEESVRRHLEALALAEAGSYVVHQVRALNGLAATAYVGGQLVVADNYGHQAAGIATTNELTVESCQASLILSAVAASSGQPADKIRHQEHAKKLLQQTSYQPPPGWPGATLL